MDAARNRHLNIKRVPEPSINTAQCSKKRAVLADRKRWYATGTMESVHCHANTCAGVLGMAWPRIGRIRIEQTINLFEQCCVIAFTRVILMQNGRDCCGIDWVDDGTAGDRVGAVPDMPQIRRQPIWRDLTVGIGAKQDTAGRDRRGSTLHRHTTGLPGILVLGRKLMFNYI